MEPITTAVEEVTIDSNRIIHETKVDFISRNIPNVIRLVQYDMTLPIISVALHQAGVRYALPTGAACNIRLKKPDGTVVYNPAYGCDSTRSVVYFVVSAQMTVVSGETNPVIEVLVNGRLAGSSPLRIVVEENPVKEDDIVSEDEVQAIIAYVEQASEARDEAVESSESAEAWAVGKIDGTDVPSTADQYHNNAKYYAEQASTSATTASTASTSASTSASQASTSATSAQNAQQAIENMTASVSSLEPDATPTVTKTTVGGVVNLAFAIPRGQDGEQGETSGIPVEEMTQAQYDALPEASKLDEKLYLITDGDSGWEADSVEYDNTASGLTADNVQDAVDEVVSNVDGMRSYHTTYTQGSAPTVDELKKANALIVYWQTADGSSYCASPARRSGNTSVFTQIWNGTRWFVTQGTIKWSKENGTLTMETVYSERQTTCVINSVTLIYA